MKWVLGNLEAANQHERCHVADLRTHGRSVRRSLEAVEEHDLADRQVSKPALDALAIAVAGPAKGDDTRLPWAHVLGDPFDEPVLRRHFALQR